MLLRRIFQKRPGASAVEFAVIAPLLFLLIVGLVVGATGVFRYQQMATLSREAARYASVHGTDYTFETQKTAATEESIHKDIVLAKAIGLDHERLTTKVTWDKNNSPTYVDDNDKVTINIVTVTVTYEWIPKAYFGGITLSSTSKMPMSH